MSSRISFACSSCRTRLRASVRFVGRATACPKCNETVVVPLRVPEEESPMLVWDDGHFSTRQKFEWKSRF
jgi:DNA-directed RNA polymerase subunit RPC12/RpoP